MSFYYITYKTLGHTHTGIFTAADKDQYNAPKKYVKLEINYLCILSIIHPENH